VCTLLRTAAEVQHTKRLRQVPTLSCELQKLQLAQGLEAEKARQLTLDHYIGQVGQQSSI
jgi:hypothetical protein